jgi:hypothetical protein
LENVVPFATFLDKVLSVAAILAIYLFTLGRKFSKNVGKGNKFSKKCSKMTKILQKRNKRKKKTWFLRRLGIFSIVTYLTRPHMLENYRPERPKFVHI